MHELNSNINILITPTKFPLADGTIKTIPTVIISQAGSEDDDCMIVPTSKLPEHLRPENNKISLEYRKELAGFLGSHHDSPWIKQGNQQFDADNFSFSYVSLKEGEQSFANEYMNTDIHIGLDTNDSLDITTVVVSDGNSNAFIGYQVSQPTVDIENVKPVAVRPIHKLSKAYSTGNPSHEDLAAIKRMNNAAQDPVEVLGKLASKSEGLRNYLAEYSQEGSPSVVTFNDERLQDFQLKGALNFVKNQKHLEEITNNTHTPSRLNKL